MFAVPGWAVDSTSLVQEKPTAKADAQQSAGASTSSSRKRKNISSHSDQTSKVSGSELEKLWGPRAAAKPLKTEQARKQDHDSKPRERSKQDHQKKQHNHQGPEQWEHRRDGPGKLERNKLNVEAAPVPAKKNKNKDKTLRPSEAQQDQQVQNKQHRKKKDERQNHINDDVQETAFPRDKILASLPPPPPAPANLTPLQSKMRNKLTSARFRHLNETLYTTSSTTAMDLFTNSPDLFAEYHAGFSQQVKDSWPVNPVERYTAAVKTRGAISTPTTLKGSTQTVLPLPRRPKTGICTVADLGCGDAPLARGAQSAIKSLSLRFHNFDLHAPNTQVTKADISRLPLHDGEIDIAVFCLSLMGTNWISFVEEAWRVLRGDGKGECWVSEVKSRFGRVKRRPGESVENSVGKRRKAPRSHHKKGEDDEQAGLGEPIFAEDSTTAEAAGDETDISAFIRVFARRGFQLREGSVDKSNKMFVSMVFIKSGIPTAGKHKGLKWTGREYQQFEEKKSKAWGTGIKGKGAGEDEMTLQEETGVLKPCVYKTR